MADTMTPEQRSRCMAAVKSKNTKPEILVRKFLFSKGLRFRIKSKLPGHPDIVLPKYKTVVFVDGCFWHGHPGCKYAKRPQSNTDFWESKISANVVRDNKVTTELRLLGWKVIRIWQCELKTTVLQAETLDRLYHLITSSCKEEADPQIAAEPLTPYGM